MIVNDAREMIMKSTTVRFLIASFWENFSQNCCRTNNWQNITIKYQFESPK
jgi:hypothetical protein